MTHQGLGEFEQLVLLAIAQLRGEAYGVPIVEEIERRTGRSVARAAVYVTLRRLEEKGFVSSWMGDPRLAGLAVPGPAIKPEHVAYVGLRDLDPPERHFIRELGIHAFTMRDIDERGLRAVMTDALEITMRGTGGIHVSCDADWVDPAEAPGVGTPVRGGATLREAHLAMEIIADSNAMLAMDLVEINPILDRHNHTAELAVDLLASAFGRRIL